MKIKYLGSAKQDLRDGFLFYESLEPGLGSYFLETLYADIDSLKLFAGIHSVHFKKYYRILSKRFPFAVYYQIDGENIKIYAVIDCRKNPAWIRKKIRMRD
ncbi:MAG: type II toxin-antitoxin system RelE/ParE family toxin [Pseudomonadota bacterium]|nr:type II toxin-antitoxin system RelE/ParE family toxin [Pseudomonadota bacterium]